MLILDTAAVLLGRLFEEEELCGGDECWVLVGPFICLTLDGSAVLVILPLAGGAGVLLEAAGSSSLRTSSSYIRYLYQNMTACESE